MFPLSFACVRIRGEDIVSLSALSTGDKDWAGRDPPPAPAGHESYLHQGDLTEGSSADDFQLFEVSDFQMQLEQQIQKRFYEFAETLLLLIPRRGDDSDKQKQKSLVKAREPFC